MLLVLHETYEATGTQSFQDTTWIKANEAVSRLTRAKAGNFKKVSQKWKSVSQGARVGSRRAQSWPRSSNNKQSLSNAQ
ncbi:BQ2448_5175 [Microbotryum intermedium]|uniref:BQ2448_5175 protein n=1 Tax=Microbotryum intermedium TaxID=269621 RepID=A0A238F6S2_9BASI|nr:BQ2448_5175 [Microbotryum intermedium]